MATLLSSIKGRGGNSHAAVVIAAFVSDGKVGKIVTFGILCYEACSNCV
jgi:hypothetical protein